jgi:hypothetical protein
MYNYEYFSAKQVRDVYKCNLAGKPLQSRRIRPICTLAVMGRFLFIFLVISAKDRFTSSNRSCSVNESKRRRQAPPQRNQTMAIIEKIAFIGNALCVSALVAFAGASFAVLIAHAFGL